MRTYRISDETLDTIWRIVDKAILDPRLDLDFRKQLAVSKAKVLEGEFEETPREDEDGIKYLQFNDIVVGREYVFRDHALTKSYLRGKRVIVTKKGRTKVTTKLLEPAGSHKIGTLFSGPPANLKEV